MPGRTGRIALTVVLPVHNAELWVADTLSSLRANVAPGIEVVLVDDGSDDATPLLAERAAHDLPGLRLLTLPRRVGLADARNAGLDAARGRYVTFLDGDDWLAPGYLPRLLAAIDELGCDFVRTDHVQVEGRRRTVRAAPQGRRGVLLDPRASIGPPRRTSMVDYPYAWAGAYRAELGELLRFPSGLHTAEDRPWIWRLHREARTFAVVSLAGVFYRRLVGTSLTQIGDARQLHVLDAYELVFAGLRGDPEAQGHWPKAAQQFLSVIGHHLVLLPRLDPGLADRFVAQVRTSVAALPEDALAQVRVRGERATALQRVLPRDCAARRGLDPAAA